MADCQYLIRFDSCRFNYGNFVSIIATCIALLNQQSTVTSTISELNLFMGTYIEII
ncbi:hypothetical protein PALB_12830 [Pseudoalteromonas luteoviolacea B = ATCC 29581]|nr:hypothetical protein PALB_12830 [Pseudoalteromonas luteoviolacea B = ATCC 29581]